jgi:ankyrin repeat protein
MTAPLQKTQNISSLMDGFMQTVQNNDDLDARFLKGVDVNQKDHFGFTALHWAVYHNNLHNIKILLLRGSRLEASRGMNALFCAIFYEKLDVLRYFIEKGFDPTMEYNGLTLQAYAQKLKRTEMLAYLRTKQIYAA